MTVFIRGPALGIAVSVRKGGFYHITADIAGLRCGFRGLCAGDMGSNIFFVFASGTFFPMTICICAPIAIVMGGSTCGTAGVAILITVVIVGMRSFGQSFGFGGIAGGAGVAFAAGFFARGLFGYGAAVPRMICCFNVTAGRTGPAMLGCSTGVATEAVIFAVDSDRTGGGRKAVLAVIRIVRIDKLQRNSCLADLCTVFDFEGKGGDGPGFGIIGGSGTVYPRDCVRGTVAGIELGPHQQTRVGNIGQLQDIRIIAYADGHGHQTGIAGHIDIQRHHITLLTGTGTHGDGAVAGGRNGNGE